MTDHLRLDGEASEEKLEEFLSTPYPEDIEAVRELGGGMVVLGAGGKMGPTLVRRAVEAYREAGMEERVVAVSRFGTPEAREALEEVGAETISADLMDEKALRALPRLPHLIYMVGTKFGTRGQEPRTWALNSYLPGRVADHFRHSRIVAFSTGNVYPFLPADSAGASEKTEPAPIGEYAQSCLGRERVLHYFSLELQIPVCLLRLNYAVEARYGVLLDIARKVFDERPVSLEMGCVNLIWQADANSICLRSFPFCQSPPRVLNVTGSEVLSVRWLARELGDRLGKKPLFRGRETETALLSDSSLCRRLIGPEKVPISFLLDLVAEWVSLGGSTLDKPTHFEVRNGAF